jgi:hypothetical protein
MYTESEFRSVVESTLAECGFTLIPNWSNGIVADFPDKTHSLVCLPPAGGDTRWTMAVKDVNKYTSREAEFSDPSLDNFGSGVGDLPSSLSRSSLAMEAAKKELIDALDTLQGGGVTHQIRAARRLLEKHLGVEQEDLGTTSVELDEAITPILRGLSDWSACSECSGMTRHKVGCSKAPK